ncbi:FtsX-like permease family protein [Dactylosporangium cerinum]|uniref:FtsX-like permease family protein n=1 Tax=Dactylosporangium cerinum TaxID=1434730 RepID=A0ABV9W7P1_9ACTN
MRGWLVSLRIARREARRAKGRTALVLSLILLPVLGLSFAAVMYDMFTLTRSEQLDRELGSFEASARWPTDGKIIQDADGYGMDSVERGQPPTPTTDALLALLPAGTHVVQVDTREIRLRGGNGEQKLAGHQLDLADPAYHKRVSVLRGTAPGSSDEIALNEAAMELVGVKLGGTVTLPGQGSARVVAEIEFPETLRPVAVLRPGTLPAPELSSNTEWLVDAPGPVTWEQVRALNQHGLLVRSRVVVLNPPPDALIWPSSSENVFGLGILVFGLGVLEIVLLAGPAFAVGARRRRRELALVAANGGTPAQLRRIVLADGALLGVVSGVVGTIAAIAIAFALRGVFEEHVAHARAGAYRVFPMALLGIAGLALVAGVGAALVPAFAAARTDVVAALAGRRNRTGPGRRWLVAGLCTLGAGAAAAGYGIVAIDSTVVMAGLVLAELGLVVCTPTLVGLIARLGRRLPLAPRIAVRDLARNRSSTAPAISAVMAAVLGAMTVGVYLASDIQRQRDMQVAALPEGYAEITRGVGNRGERADPLPTQRLVETATSTLPVSRTVELRGVACAQPAAPDAWCWLNPVRPEHRRCPFRPGNVTKEEERKAARDPRCRSDGYMMPGNAGNATTIVDDGTTFGLISAAQGEDLARAEATLRAGGVVVADPELVEDGKLLLGVPSPDDPEGVKHTVSVPGYVSTTAVSRIFVAISPEAVAKTGLTVDVRGIVAATTRLPTRAEEGAFNAATEGLGNYYHGGIAVPYRPDATVELLVLAIVAAVIALGAAGISTGLAAVDSRPDLATLGAVGASPAVRRRLTLSQAGVIAGFGSLLGAVAGIGAGWAVLASLNRVAGSTWPSETLYTMQIPWLNIAVAVLVVPLVAMFGTALFTRARLPIERRA